MQEPREPPLPPPTRRGVMAGVAGIAAAGALPSAGHAEAAGTSAPYATAGAQLRALAAGAVSSRALTDAAISRIEARDGRINAIVVRDFERARAAADAADAARARGEQRPLLGLPMTVKEQFNVAGLPTCWGFPQFRDWHPKTDSLAVQRLKAAGAVILGKSNVPTGLSDWQSTNAVYGTTNNPWDLSRTPGGSSGGAAAALAAGFVPLEMGSDIGGSLRVPAHFCGVFAHKPSLELIPGRGSGPPETPAIPTRGDMAVIGPMARSAADLALALEVLAGPDEMWDGIGYRLALPPPLHDTLAGYRVLLLDRHPLCPTESGIHTALDDLATRLAKAGTSVLRSADGLPDLARTTRVYVELLMAVFSADLPAQELARRQLAAAGLAPEDRTLRAAELHGFAMSHQAWIHSSRIREVLRAQWQTLFQQVDLVLCPPMTVVAFHHKHEPLETRRLLVDGQSVLYTDQIAWEAVATLCGLPATVAPIGRSEGLPVGVQIIGGYLQDRTTIAFASLIEQAFGGFVPPPDPS